MTPSSGRPQEFSTTVPNQIRIGAYDISPPGCRLGAPPESAQHATGLPPSAPRGTAPPRAAHCRSYNTPVQAYHTPDGWVVGLAYDRDSPFALNLLAAGGGEMTRAGRRYRITRPRRVGREVLELLPVLASLQMRVVGIEDFLQFDATPPQDR